MIQFVQQTSPRMTICLTLVGKKTVAKYDFHL